MTELNKQGLKAASEVATKLRKNAAMWEKGQNTIPLYPAGQRKLAAELSEAATLIESLSSRLASAEMEKDEALRPFAKHIDEMKFDLDNHGSPLPDEQAVGWVYVTIGDFRRAREAMGDSNG